LSCTVCSSAHLHSDTLILKLVCFGRVIEDEMTDSRHESKTPWTLENTLVVERVRVASCIIADITQATTKGVLWSGQILAVGVF